MIPPWQERSLGVSDCLPSLQTRCGEFPSLFSSGFTQKGDNPVISLTKSESIQCSSLMKSPVNDKSLQEHWTYLKEIQNNCKQIHRGQFHSPDSLETARRTPDDPVDLHHPAVPWDTAAEFQVLTPRDYRKSSCLKKYIALYKYTGIPEKSPGIFCTSVNKDTDDCMKETGFPETVGERSTTDTRFITCPGNKLKGIGRNPAVHMEKEQDLTLCGSCTGVHLEAPA
jgi:hypothetical protein